MPKSAYGKITKKLVREALEARGLLAGPEAGQAPGKATA
jgi:hypothetical protein